MGKGKHQIRGAVREGETTPVLVQPALEFFQGGFPLSGGGGLVGVELGGDYALQCAGDVSSDLAWRFRGSHHLGGGAGGR